MGIKTHRRAQSLWVKGGASFENPAGCLAVVKKWTYCCVDLAEL